jgi:hypothetical protein
MRRIALCFLLGSLPLSACRKTPPPAPASAPEPPPKAAVSDGGPATATAPLPPPTPPPVVVPKPPAKAPKPGTRTAGGLKIELRADGKVVVRGRDRWGGKIDTTYESPGYFRDAIPVLARNLTPDAAAILTKLATDLAP